jgi:hypothetical protein
VSPLAAVHHALFKEVLDVEELLVSLTSGCHWACETNVPSKKIETISKCFFIE